ncbi:integrase, catalytic region, zinc finger, CCHC-type containing protein [Tanacetum coccineum]
MKAEALKEQNTRPIKALTVNNRKVHLVYLRHLKESVDILREIVEEAKVERPLDRSLVLLAVTLSFLRTTIRIWVWHLSKVFIQQIRSMLTPLGKEQLPLRTKLQHQGQFGDSDLEVACWKESFYEIDEVFPNLLAIQSLQEQIMVMASAFEPLEIRRVSNKTVRFIRADNDTEFVNKTLYDHYEKVGIFHQKTVPRTPQQNGVVERERSALSSCTDNVFFPRHRCFRGTKVSFGRASMSMCSGECGTGGGSGRERGCATFMWMDASLGPSQQLQSILGILHVSVILQELLHDQVILHDMHRISEWQSAQIAKKMEYLERIITKKGVAIDPTKIQAMQN